jgi:hypothetical protein
MTVQLSKLPSFLVDALILAVLAATFWVIGAIWNGGTPYGFRFPILIVFGGTALLAATGYFSDAGTGG